MGFVKKGSFDKNAIIEVRKKLTAKSSQPETEEATKQWFVMPLLVALGYDPYSSDIIPEYTLDVGVKKGEKVDYALQINNQLVIIVECKQLNVNLSEKHISQLFRYFTIAEVHIAVLTNGDDYWFFTDSQKENVMDLEPYLKIRLSTASDDAIDKFNMYSKDMIQYADIAKLIQREKFQHECHELVLGLRNNCIPTWLIDALIERSGDMGDINKFALAEYLQTEVQNIFKGYKGVSKSDSAGTSVVEKLTKDSAAQLDEEEIKKDKPAKSSEKSISNIKLNHEYVFNDYSDGSWKYHKLDYAVILGVRYDGISGRQVLINAVEELLKQGKIDPTKIIDEEQFQGSYKVCKGKGKDVQGAHYYESYDIYITTIHSMSAIIKFLERLIDYAGLDYSCIKLSFSS